MKDQTNTKYLEIIQEFSGIAAAFIVVIIQKYTLEF